MALDDDSGWAADPRRRGGGRWIIDRQNSSLGEDEDWI